MSQNSVTSPDKSSDAHQISNGREESQKYKGVEKYVVVLLKYLMNDIYLIFLLENWLDNTDLFFCELRLKNVPVYVAHVWEDDHETQSKRKSNVFYAPCILQYYI